MLKKILCACITVGCLAGFSVEAKAQEVVHALTGTVSSIDTVAKTITLFTDKGSEAQFRPLADPQERLVFDKKIRANAMAADTFKEYGKYVIVFYFGYSDVRTAVAVRSLGQGPFMSAIGTVVKFDGRGHSISIKDESGAVQSFKITGDTIAETGVGVMDGFKFHTDEGNRVRVVATTVNDSPTALFINER